MPDPAALDDQANWLGPSYALAVTLAPGADARAAVRAAWSHPDLAPAVPDAAAAGAPAMRGWARTPAGRMVCATRVVTGGAGRPDRFDLCLPTGPLAALVPSLRHPIHGYEQNRAWREPVDVWLTAVADRVAREVPVRAAAIGEEVSGADLGLGPGGEPPAERGVSILVPSRRGPGLVRFAPTRWFTPW